MSTSDDGDDGVWTPEVESAFKDALVKWPQCGRRKIVFEDKMFGRNEIIAMWIQRQTGQMRTRKQVSSHIQVIGRKRKRDPRKPYDGQASSRTRTELQSDDDDDDDDDISEPIVATAARGGGSTVATSRGGSAVATGSRGGGGGMVGAAHRKKERMYVPHPLTMTYFAAYRRDGETGHTHNIVLLDQGDDFTDPELLDLTQVRDKFPMLEEFSECTPKSALFLVKFWVDLSFDDLGPESYLGVDMMFESDESLRIECSTTVILKGRQVVEKIQVEEGRRALGKTLFELKDSVMCDVMVEFIEKLRSVDTPAVVNTVLENFSVLQVVRDEKTKDVLSCTAFLFEASRQGSGPRRQVFRMYEPTGFAL